MKVLFPDPLQLLLSAEDTGDRPEESLFVFDFLPNFTDGNVSFSSFFSSNHFDGFWIGASAFQIITEINTDDSAPMGYVHSVGRADKIEMVSSMRWEREKENMP